MNATIWSKCVAWAFSGWMMKFQACESTRSPRQERPLSGCRCRPTIKRPLSCRGGYLSRSISGLAVISVGGCSVAALRFPNKPPAELRAPPYTGPRASLNTKTVEALSHCSVASQTVNKGARRAFGFDCPHMAGNALAAFPCREHRGSQNTLPRACTECSEQNRW
jgi:hypothetical protein